MVRQEADGTKRTLGTSAATWGGISGSLSDQEDLQGALNGKPNIGLLSVFVLDSSFLNASEVDSGTLVRMDGNNVTLLADPQNVAADGSAGDFQFQVEGPGNVFIEDDDTYDGPLPISEASELVLLAGEFLRCSWDASSTMWSLEASARIGGTVPIWNADQGVMQYIVCSGNSGSEILTIADTP